jgi:peptidyl-prolyl cis-trans isomerase SurA
MKHLRLGLTLALACATALPAAAQAKTPPHATAQPSAPAAPKAVSTAGALAPSVPGLPAAEPPPPHTTIVEQIVARVNDKIITTSDYNSAESSMMTDLQQQAQQSGQPVTAEEIAKQKRDLLSNLIDDQLLVQRAKDLGLSAETQTILQLDQLRKQNHLATMQDLQRAVEAQGENYEDFKQAIRNQLLQQMVIEQDVAPRVPQATPQQIAAYYNAHKAQFVTPDEVGLSEILIKTQGKPKSELARLKSLADQVQQRAVQGESFRKLAQKYSEAASASSGGDIGFEKKSQLAASLAKLLWSLPVGGVTPVQKISSGYLILKVTARHHAGQETLQQASADINYVLYQQMMKPELKTYLDGLRRNAYITVAKGYFDSGVPPATSESAQITNFQRVLPSDLPKPTDKDKKNNGFSMGGGGGGR